jgi:hypothetical protein
MFLLLQVVKFSGVYMTIFSPRSFKLTKLFNPG